MNNADRLAIQVLTYNRKDEVLCTLERVSPLGEAASVWVVDNGSSDGTTHAIRQRFPAIRVIQLATNAGAAGRNAGVREMDVPYVALSDDDTWWTPGSLTRAVDLLDANPRLAVITARVLYGPGALLDPTSLRMAHSPFANTLRLPGTEVFGFLAGACVMRRAAFLEAGGFEPRLFLGGEETLLTIDLAVGGWHMGYAPDVIVRHDPSPQRDAPARRRLLLRNAVWCAWLRRPFASAFAETRRLARKAAREGILVPTAASTLSGVPWIMRERRVIPPRVEQMLQRLDAFNREPLAAIARNAPA